MKQHAHPSARGSFFRSSVAAPAKSIVATALSTHGDAAFESLLASGGDERLSIDPRTGRSRYGVPSGLARDEIWFASSTASAVSPRGHASARAAWARTTAHERATPLPVWFDGVRQRLLDLFGIPGAEIALSASGTEAELLILAAAQSLSARPLTNLIVAPRETGRGVIFAASGRHFLDSAPFSALVARGGGLAGFEGGDRQIETIDLRDGYGVPLEPEQFDLIITRRVESLVASGRDVLLHLLDCSKAGRSGPSRRAAAALAAAYPDRVLVIVDACQLRCSREQIRADLKAGFAVMLTGSKFGGGPPFAGALLFPRTLLDRLAEFPLPEGLAAYSAALDWSPRLRDRLRGEFSSLANLGLGLRWECALAELEAYFALDADLRQKIAVGFARRIYSNLAAAPQLKLADPDWGESAGARSIFPILTFDERGVSIDAEKLCHALRNPKARPGRRARMGRPIHLGQPVPIGAKQAPRVCLGAPQVNAVAERMANGLDFNAAFQPLSDDIDEVFAQWTDLAARMAHEGG